MAEGFSTDSYPKPPALPAQKSLLDNVNQFQDTAMKQRQYERQGIALGQDKLKFVADQMADVNNELSIFANDPNTTPQEVWKTLKNRLDLINADPKIKEQLEAQFSNIPNVPLGKDGSGNPQLSRNLDQLKRKVQDSNARFLSLYGANVTMDDGANVTPGRVYERGAPVPTGYPIQKQAPPTQSEFDENNNPRYRGSQNPDLPAGAQPVEGGFPGQYRPAGRLPVATGQAPIPQPRPMLPVGKGNLTNDGEITGVDVQDVAPATFTQRYQGPTGAKSGTDPMFEPGKAKYSADLDTATKLNTTNKPAELALKMMDGLRSGPGTALWHQMLAFGKTNGLLRTDAKDDPTVVYQTINKLMHNFIRNSGSRSDADLAQLEASNPDLSQHINPALENLTREQVGLNRVQAARPYAFKSKNFTNYGEHSSTFPQDQDEKAYTINTLPKKEAQKLYQEMKTKALKGDREAIRFIKSLALANEIYK